MWSKGKVILLAKYPINSLPYHFTSIRPTRVETQLFQNLTLKLPRSRSWVRSKVEVTYYSQYPTDALPFASHQSDQAFPEIWPYSYLTLERPIRNFEWELAKITVSATTSRKSIQVIIRTVATLLRFVVIGRVVLILSCRQANFC